jgi:hypothetical protein
MRPSHLSVVAIAIVLPLVGGLEPVRTGETAERSSLSTVEGVVEAVETRWTDTDEEVLSARLRVDSPDEAMLDVLLAPWSALSETGFEIEPGDRLRARIFLSDSDDQPVEAHKVMNLSRGTMVRLRTLRRVPLWDGEGRWQGGPCREQGGGHGRRHHHGGHP